MKSGEAGEAGEAREAGGDQGKPGWPEAGDQASQQSRPPTSNHRCAKKTNLSLKDIIIPIFVR